MVFQTTNGLLNGKTQNETKGVVPFVKYSATHHKMIGKMARVNKVNIHVKQELKK